MFIFYHEKSRTFHLQNNQISYIMCVLPGGEAAQLYFGKRIHDREDFSYLLEGAVRSHMAYPQESGSGLSLEHIKLEYPSFGTGDFRRGAVEILQKNGSRESSFRFKDYRIMPGKPALTGLPSVYTEEADEAQTLVMTMEDPVSSVLMELYYTIFADEGIIAKSAKIISDSDEEIYLTRAMSLCQDLPDSNYEWMQFSGSWGRERFPVVRPLAVGTTEIESLRGHSSHQENPFVILKRPHTTEASGEAIGFSLIYSGNFSISAQVDPYRVTRVLAGINPEWFSWKLDKGESFQTPEAVMVYTEHGLNDLSRIYHNLFRSRLVRGYWRDKERPILINNWEATYFDFNEEKLLKIASRAKECGVELFVLDDGWFGARRSDNAGLGDWVAAKELLPDGIEGLSSKIEALGMKFGLWIEPEMVNPDSDLYRAHPDWALCVPGRTPALGRNQLVLDFSRPEVVDHIHHMIAAILKNSRISYIKWDMNRSITDCLSAALPPERQGEVYHRYILGVYNLYERLIREFPHVLFESCAGGGGRFDPGMLYYAPQTWTSDNTDAAERVKIQYGTSYCYPVVSMGSHVSAVPNHQVGRITPLKTRAETAFFGTFGYELDLNRLSAEEQNEIKEYTSFMKKYRRLIQFGTFYRLQSPFEHNESAWMVVSDDRKQALVGFYRTLGCANVHFSRIVLQGLEPDFCYSVIAGEAVYREKTVKKIESFYGDELMNLGLIVSDGTSGKTGEGIMPPSDFFSSLFLLNACAECPELEN